MQSEKRQCSLLDYLRTGRLSPIPAKSFFDLPYKLRLKIYVLSGIKRLTPQKLTANKLSDVYVIRRCPGYKLYDQVLYTNGFLSEGCALDPSSIEWRPCHCYIERGRGKSLLLTSRRVKHEVSAILYGSGTGLGPGDGGFENLRSFSVSKIQNLKELSVQLNLGLHFGRACRCDSCAPQGPKLRQTVLERVDRTSREVVNYHEREIKEFRRTIEFLAAHITPGQLSLTLDLNADCESAAKECLEILLRLPRLQDCAIRFRKNPDCAVRQVIRRTVQKLTATPASFSRFNDLPTEIKTLILQKTALFPTVTHEWHSETRTFGTSRCCASCCRGHARFNCFCSLRSAYSTWCQCWHIPHELFAVSKEMRHLAAEVFFASKRIFVANHPLLLHAGHTFFSLFEAIPEHFLQYIRHLHIDLSLDRQNYQTGNLDLVSSVDLKYKILPLWKKFIQLTWKYCNVEKMIMTLDLTRRLRKMIRAEPNRAKDQAYHEDDKLAWPMYCALAETMRETIVELQDQSNEAQTGSKHTADARLPQEFHVHISSPMHLRHRSIRHQSEKMLECFVMGVSYDSDATTGKAKKTHFPQYQVFDYYCQGMEDAYWHKVNEIGSSRHLSNYSDLALTSHHLEGCEKCHGRPPKYCMAPKSGWDQELENRWEWWELEEKWRRKLADPSATGNYRKTRYQELQMSLE